MAVSLAVKIIVMSLNTLVSVFGSLGSLLIILSIKNRKELRSDDNYFVFNIALSDFIVCAFVMPITISFAYVSPENDTLCLATAALSVILQSIVNFSLFMLALNSYISVCRSQHLYSKLYKRKYIILQCIVPWVFYSATYTAFLGLNIYGYNEGFGSCLFNRNGLKTAGFSLPPFVAAAFCYIKVFINSRKRFSRQTRVVKKNSLLEVDSNNQCNIEVKGKTTAAFKTHFLLWISVMIAWAPFVIQEVVSAAVVIDPTVGYLLFVLARSRPLSTFIILIVKSVSFRESCKDLLTM